MKIDRKRFGVNRKIAPNLSIDRFFSLVHECGLNKVELRNDMPSGKVTDDISYAKVIELADKYALEILTINAVYPFNQLTDETLEKTKALLVDAQSVGAKALVLCPLNDGTVIPAEKTCDAIRRLTEIFAEYGVQGLVEPLGFTFSSLRSAVLAQQLIREAGSSFKIVLDSFHHFLYENAEQEFAPNIDVSNIGLVHLSGVEDTRPTKKLTDEERIMLTNKDIMGNKEQVQRLEELGYRGNYSFEPFSSTLASWSESEIVRQINQSISLMTGNK